jgi:hypothetical protein
MTWSFKNLALVSGALLVLCGLLSSAASASAFTAEKAPATLTGAQDGPYKIEATGLAIECKSSSLHGEINSTSFEQITVTPFLSECSAFGFAATVTFNGCQLVLHSDGTGDLVCPAGKDATLDVGAGICSVHMPPQNGVKTSTYTKVLREGKNALTLDVALTNLHGTHTDSTFVCPFNGSGTFINTKASGTGLLWAESEGKPVGFTWDE